MTTWQMTADHQGWFKIQDGTEVTVTKDELRAWEKTQRTPEGKDALRGVKLKDRLAGVLASRSGAVADATGTP